MNALEITKSFETVKGTNVEVIGTVSDTGKINLDVVVDGHGSMGGTISFGRHELNGTVYAGGVGILALTQENIDLILGVNRELSKKRDEIQSWKKEYGTYEEVEINHSWMSGTY